MEIESPAHIVDVRGEVNDTEIPKLQVNRETKEISFDWRDLFSLYFGEEKLFDNLLEDWVTGSKAFIIL